MCNLKFENAGLHLISRWEGPKTDDGDFAQTIRSDLQKGTHAYRMFFIENDQNGQRKKRWTGYTPYHPASINIYIKVRPGIRHPGLGKITAKGSDFHHHRSLIFK